VPTNPDLVIAAFSYSAPAAPTPVFGNFPAGKQILTLAGVSDPASGINGDLWFAGLLNGLPAWSTNGSLVAGAGNVIASSNGTAWTVTHASTYSATKTSEALTPDGLTSWTVTTGTGSPTLVAKALDAPASVQAGGQPSAPSAPAVVLGSNPYVASARANRTIGTGDSAVTYTSRDTGNPAVAITVAQPDAAAAAATTVSVSGFDITVQSGAKARMITAGGYLGAGKVLEWTYFEGGKRWSNAGTKEAGDPLIILQDEGFWYCLATLGGVTVYEATTNEYPQTTWPDDAGLTWAAVDLGQAEVTFTAGASSANQAVAAVAASVAASALVTAAAGGDGSGVIATSLGSALTGGAGPYNPVAIQG
jgi:hypothetical protein